jgi:AcrR family transcriptional regulator
MQSLERKAGFQRSFEHSTALFEAALAEFIERGYEQASINTILHAANMSKGQFYYHFTNKEDLYLSLIGVLIERKQTFLASVMQPGDFQQDIFGIFQTQIRYSMAFAREYPAISRFAESFLKEQGSPIYEKALATYNFEDNAAIDQLIEAAYRKGEFRDDLPLPFIRKVIGYLFTHAADIAQLDQVEDFEEEMRYLIEFIRSGLGRDT